MNTTSLRYRLSRIADRAEIDALIDEAAVKAARPPRPGDIVTVRGGFGKDSPERVTVLSIGNEAGQTVIDYRDGTGRQRWAYLWQVGGDQ